jgi:hypothetical protein
MHRHRIIAQIYLIFSILNLVLAAPIVVQRTHETSSDNLQDLEMGPAEDVAAIPNGSGELEPAPDRSMSAPSSPNAMTSPKHSLDGSVPPPSSPNAPASPQHSLDGSMSPHPSPNAPASPQHSLDGSMDSGYPTPHLESASSASGYSWMLERPARESPHNPLPPHAVELSHDLLSEPPENSRMENLGIIKFLAGLGTVLGGVWGLNKLIHRDCQDC